MRIAHLSDPHFSTFDLSLTQFLSKRWIGNFNYLLTRSYLYDSESLFQLPALFESLGVDFIFFTGDFTSTALPSEFEKALAFTSLFKSPVFTVPGNHDVYTRASEKKKIFYTYFKNPSLEKARVFKTALGKDMWAIGLDCAVASAPLLSYGTFFPEMEETLTEVLATIDPTHKIVLYNHFPLSSHGRPRHDLRRGDKLRSILARFPHPKIYLHGHDHVPYIEDRRHEKLPLIFNSGSVVKKVKGGFSLFEFKSSSFLHQYYRYDRYWTCFQETQYTL